MAIELVDATQLDSDLTDIADAIRLKGGTSAQLTFPSDFLSAIAAIPSGGGLALDDIANGTEPSGAIEVGANNILSFAFKGRVNITRVKMLSITNNINNNAFDGCTSITIAIIKKTSNNIRSGASILAGCTSLITVDADMLGQWGQYLFSGCSNFNTLIIRNTTPATLWGGVGVFNNTPFANGGAGGTIYIPESLYNHLGDGGASDYKAATNWSTLDSYGTVTWAKIEGSAYDGYYADGTPI